VRVVAGSARGRRLKAPPGIRPTADIVREAMFDVLESQGADLSRVLDLYAGSGALGIEALSRGDDGTCDFVEREAANGAVIRANLAATGLESHGKVHRLPAARAAERLHGPYSLVLADPPYNDEAALDTIGELARSQLVDQDTTLVLEHSSRTEPPQEMGPLPLAWTRRYGDTQISIFRK
jgi:16S rRNA (guanine966-N2)-methyltransferase